MEKHLYTTLDLPKFTHLPIALQTENIGDDVQIECANRLWGVNNYVDRDVFEHWPSEAVIPFIGWYGYDSFVEPPKSQCILISFHLALSARKKILKNKKFLSWFRYTAKEQKIPVYTRDTSTRDWLRNLDIEAEFGGCITSTIDKYDGIRLKTLSIDVPDNLCNSDEKLSSIRNYLSKYSAEKRILEAQKFLNKLQTAQLVHTSRLHVALPCRAMGTPFYFYNFNIFGKERLSGHSLIDCLYFL